MNSLNQILQRNLARLYISLSEFLQRREKAFEFHGGHARHMYETLRRVRGMLESDWNIDGPLTAEGVTKTRKWIAEFIDAIIEQYEIKLGERDPARPRWDRTASQKEEDSHEPKI